VNEWLQENKDQFIPPVCNKMLHERQLKVMFVGGPNTREDYHINEGEEFFYMVKGDMCLKTIEKGEKRDVVIREGECFLLPGKIPHSPQRKANTIGLVIERERLRHERDGLRFHIKDTTVPLFERWFHCQSLGTQLVPIIKEFFNSSECKTQTPTDYSVPEKAPYTPNDTETTDDPVSAEQFLELHQRQIKTRTVPMFRNTLTTNVNWHGPGIFDIFNDEHETFLWQWVSDAKVTFENETKPLPLNSCIIVPKNIHVSLENKNDDCVTLSVAMPLPK